MSPGSRIAIALSLLIATPAGAQNVAATPATPPTTVAPPPPGPSTPVTPAPPPAPTENIATPQDVTAAAPAPAPPPPPLEIDPDAAYPNGFADPIDPAATNLSVDRGNERRFPWGLLGLLGLLGLIPLFRKGGRISRTVYVDRDDPKRVLREERVED